jgi:hypothetical protein
MFWQSADGQKHSFCHRKRGEGADIMFDIANYGVVLVRGNTSVDRRPFHGFIGATVLAIFSPCSYGVLVASHDTFQAT